MALSGKVGAVYVQDPSVAAIAFTDEATTKNGTFDTYYITNRTKAYWDKSTALVVKKNGAAITTGFSVEYAGGYIRFNPALITSDVITVTGAYLTLVQEGGMYNWSVDLEAETSDCTTFASNGWKENLATLKGFSGGAEGYWGDSGFFNALGKEVVVALYVDNTSNKRRYEGFAILNADSIETPVDDLITESIEIQGTGPLYYREG